MSRILMVRHGETTVNSGQRFWGKTDVELSELGLKQAECVRERLAVMKIDAAYASTLKRATVTAGIITQPRPVNVITNADLAEIDFGEFEGLTFEEISQHHPDMVAQWLNWNISRFPGGESREELGTRVARFAPLLGKHLPDETVLIVAHAGSLRVLLCELLQIEAWRWRQFRLDLASLSIVQTYPQGAILTLLNDVSHLK